MLDKNKMDFKKGSLKYHTKYDITDWMGSQTNTCALINQSLF